MVIAIDFMVIDTMFESHLYGYLNTSKGLCCVVVLATDFMLVDTMFELHFYGYISTGIPTQILVMNSIV